MIQVVLAIVFVPLMCLILLLVLVYMIAESVILHVQSAAHLAARSAGSLAWDGLFVSHRRPIRR